MNLKCKEGTTVEPIPFTQPNDLIPFDRLGIVSNRECDTRKVQNIKTKYKQFLDFCFGCFGVTFESQ